MEMPTSHIWQLYTKANGFKDFIQPWRAKAHHWMKKLNVILYAMKFSEADMERNSAYPGH